MTDALLLPDAETASRLFFRTGILVLLLSVGILLAVLVMRSLQDAKDRRYARLVQAWRPVLSAAALGQPVILPEPASRDMPALLTLWNHAVEAAGGPLQPGMALLARRTGMDKAALRLLEHGWLRKRLLAIVTLGNLRERAALDALLGTVRAGNPFLSLAAGRAAVQVDPAAAMPVLAPLIASRADWPRDKVAGLLREAGPEAVTAPLVAVLPSASREQAPRLVRFLEFADPGAARQTLRRLLGAPADEEVTAACLHVIGRLGNRDDLETVRGLLGHPGWIVRLHAASALGHLGEAGDEARLAGMLRDPQWWVRYRAAQVLAGFKSMGIGRLRDLYQAEIDTFARDILREAAAERGMAL